MNSSKSFTSIRPWSWRTQKIWEQTEDQCAPSLVVCSPPLGPGVPKSRWGTQLKMHSTKSPLSWFKSHIPWMSWTFTTIITNYLLFILCPCSVNFSTSALYKDPVWPTRMKAVDSSATVRISRFADCLNHSNNSLCSPQ